MAILAACSLRPAPVRGITRAMQSEARFVGSIPEMYDRYLGPTLMEPYARELAARLPARARRVLEVAAGTGRVTRHLLAAMAPGTQLVATDLNEPMLEHARTLFGEDSRLVWKIADAQELPVSEATFDAVVCQFGIMFVPDKPRALREMKRVLRPGGTLLLDTWHDLAQNRASGMLHELALELFPDDPPLFMAVPFAMSDPEALRTLARDAGFHDVRVDTVAVTGEAESAIHLAKGFVRGNPLWNQLHERGVDAEAFEARVTGALARAFGERPCRVPLVAHVLTAIA